MTAILSSDKAPFLKIPSISLSRKYRGFRLSCFLAFCIGLPTPLWAADEALTPLPEFEEHRIKEETGLQSSENFGSSSSDTAAFTQTSAVLPVPHREQNCTLTATANCFSPSEFLPHTATNDFPTDIAGPPNTPTYDGNLPPSRYRSFGSQAGTVKWELAAILAYFTAINGRKLTEDPKWPGTHSEGWFGKSTPNMGVDKLAHSYNTYLLSEIIYGRLKRKTGNAPGIQFTAAALASGVMLYTELWDSIESTAGWSWEDVTFNTLGAGFSILRNSIPKLDEKLDYRMMIVPNSDIYTFEGKRHFEQQHFFFALKFSGFDGLKKGPLRFLELHAGYYAKDFDLRDRELGREPKRRIFVGVGLNLRELFFKNSRSRVGRAAGEVMDYWTPPYTAIHRHITN